MFQSLREDSYDHHVAIYILLCERITHHRSSLQIEQRADPMCQQKRRPSNIAEQAMRSMRGHQSLGFMATSLDMTTSYDGGAGLCPACHMTLCECGSQTGHPSVDASPMVREVSPTPGDSAYQPPLTSVGYSSQSVEYQLGSMGGLLQGGSSIDEGVEADISLSDSSFSESARRIQRYHQRSNNTPSQDSAQGSVGSTYSNYESFDSTIDTDFTASLPSCTGNTSLSMESAHSSAVISSNLTPLKSHANVVSRHNPIQGDRLNSKSPIHAAARRASDGLVSKIIIEPKASESEETSGLLELNSLHMEHQKLQNIYATAAAGLGGTTTTTDAVKGCLSKKISVPENFLYGIQRNRSVEAWKQDEGTYKPLQHQLFQVSFR